MKGYVAYGQKVGLTVVEHSDISADENGYSECKERHELEMDINSFRKKDIDDIKRELVLKTFLELDTLCI